MAHTDSPTKFFQRAGKPRLAYRQHTRDGPGILWLGGYASDMEGTKAAHLHHWAVSHDRSFLRFDYAGHGQSDGAFTDGCISDWADDARDMLDSLTTGPQILVGSSMGAWIALLLAKTRPERLAGLVLIAPAPDFTQDLMWPSWTKAQQETIMREGILQIPSQYDDTMFVYTKRLIEDGATNRVLTAPLSISCPTRIIQGMADDVVPWQHAMRLAEHLQSPALQVHMTKDGDHRMSTDGDLARLTDTLDRLGGGAQ